MVSANLPKIVLRGAGDLGSGVAYRLYQAGYRFLMTELAQPLLVRRAVCFGSAVLASDGQAWVENIRAQHVHTWPEVATCIQHTIIPVAVANELDWRDAKPSVVIDVRMAKRNIDTTSQDAALVIALGPGFTAGVDCHAVIETNRGHRLGRVIWEGTAEPNTGTPGNVAGKTDSRVLRAPCDGYVLANYAIGDSVVAGDVIATVDKMPIVAPFDGVLRGIIHETVPVWAGLKIGDLDPRGDRNHCFEISDKALAIGGGVLEALLARGILPMKMGATPDAIV